jgi:cation:H+ antiporter
MVDAIVLFGFFALFLYTALKSGKVDDAGEPAQKPAQSLPRALAFFVVSFLVLLGSSRLMVWGAIEVAQTLGIDEVIIGLTIVAVGTSLPELASSIIAVRKNQHDIALGNVIGSNIFNTLAVVGASALIRPISTAPEILTRDMVVMSVLTASLLIIGIAGRQKPQISRAVGVLLLVSYTAYTILLISQATA